MNTSKMKEFPVFILLLWNVCQVDYHMLMEKSLISYMKPYRKECIFAPLFKLLEALLELFVPLVVASIIDYGINNNDVPYILKMCLLLVGLAILGLSVSITAQYFSAKAASLYSRDVKAALFRKIESLGKADLDKVGEATLITRMTSDMNLLQNGVNMTLRLLLRSPFVVFGAAIMAFTVNVKAALVFAVTIPLLALAVALFMAVSLPRFKKVQALLDKVLSRTRENLVGVRVMRAFALEQSEEKAFKEENKSLYLMQIAASRISILTNPVTSAIINLSIIALLYYGAINVNAGSLSQGELVALINYMNQILVELIKLANLIITITKAINSGYRISDVFHLRSSISYGSASEEISEDEAISFENVSFAYSSGAKNALSDISFTLKKGEVLGVIGGTGSGKSTLCALISRLYDASSGSVRLFGREIKDYSESALSELVSVVLQKARLFKGTIRSNLQFVKGDATDDEMNRALEIARAKEFVERKGLDATVEALGKNLSGGQRQRLSIARAVLKGSRIIVFDDSSSALDYKTESELRSQLKKIDATLVIVSQRASSMLHADNILVLDGGRVVASGKHEELLKSSPIYSEIYYTQFEKEEQSV